MKVTRRQFLEGGVAAFTVTFAAPAVLSDLARAQGSSGRHLVVLYLGGGNDALSMLVPYQDQFYFSRRPTIAIPSGSVLQVGTDASRVALGFHPRLTGLKEIFDQGKLAVIQRTGYENQTRSHFQGIDVWATANPTNFSGMGWIGRYLDLLPSPVDPLVGWNTSGDSPRVLLSRTVSVPSIRDPRAYAFASPNAGAEAAVSRAVATRISSHVPIDRPQLSLVYESVRAAMGTLDRVANVATYTGTVSYPTTGFGAAMRAIAGAIVRGVGSKVFYVTTGGYDTHANQNPNGPNGTYATLMAALNDGLTAFYTDLRNQSALDDTLLMTFSEFGRRISENGSAGTDHGAAALMMVIGGRVNGGLYGTSANLNPDPGNPTLENGGADVRYTFDFRSVYARVIDGWLGADSAAILGGDFRRGELSFI